MEISKEGCVYLQIYILLYCTLSNHSSASKVCGVNPLFLRGFHMILFHKLYSLTQRFSLDKMLGSLSLIFKLEINSIVSTNNSIPFYFHVLIGLKDISKAMKYIPYDVVA